MPLIEFSVQDSKSALVEQCAKRIDDHLIYGRPLRPIKMPRYEDPVAIMREARQYRREHPSDKVLRAIEKHLARRRIEPTEANEDIVVDQHSPWSWQHDEIDIRARCFGLMEIADSTWFPPKKKEPPGGWAPSEGWLLVENYRIVGAAEFIQFPAWDFISQSAIKTWVWDWVWIDPEHRRKGVVSRRLPIWEARYGDFVIDQPNPYATALLEKSGSLHRHLIKGTSRNGVAFLSEWQGRDHPTGVEGLGF